MKIIEKRIPWFKRLNAELYFLPIINLVIIIVDFSLFMQYWELIEIVILVIIFLSLLRKSSRIIYKIEFDDLKSKVDIYFYQFIIWRNSKSISYAMINYNYKRKSYGMGNLMYSLIFLSSYKFIAEIREKNRMGWSKNEILKIKDKIDFIKDF
ncbi:MAG TPA: hypothetical protein VIN10_00875 [Bacteroidales bacterium]